MNEWFYNWFWVQQDYVWFVAGIGWLAVFGIWWQARRTREGERLPDWIAWSAAMGVCTAAASILILITPVKLEMNQPPHLVGDVVLGVILAVHAVGWWFSGLAGQRGRAVLTGMIGLVAAFSAAWRYDRPLEGTMLVGIMLLGAGAWWLWARDREPGSSRWRGALIAAALAPMCGTAGPLAYGIQQTQRWHDLSPLGPWSALAQIVAVAAIIMTWQRQQCAGSSTFAAEELREQRWFYGGVAAWLVLGLGFAIVAGNAGRRSFEENALGRVRAAAALMNRTNLDVLVDDRFRLGEIQWWGAGGREPLPLAFSEHVQQYAPPLAEELSKIVAAHPDVQWVTLDALRDGWLVATVFPSSLTTRYGHVTLLRRVTTDEEDDWAEKTARFYGPTSMSPGPIVFARAPLIGVNQRMAGWLTFSFNVSQWVAAQAQPRSLAYFVVALGLVIGRQLLTQRHRLRERDRAHAEAVAAQNASRLKTTFLANVSHELRTPLQTIMGYTDLLLPNLDAKDRDRLLAVREHADLMGRLVNDLIDLSAAESGNFHLIERPVAVVDQVVQTAESLRPKAETKGLAVTVDVSPEIPCWLLADPQRIRQIVLNLVGNAVKYTDRGRVEVKLEFVERQSEWVELELHVIDTGPGIPLAEQAHLFAAFQRLDLTAEREGTGLGLAIVAAVCRAMRGSVRVESDGRTGSRFIARWRLQITTAPAAIPSAGSVPLHGRKILIADDNALVRDLFVAYLTECGAVCATAGDGVEALRRMRNESFDAVVLDLAMPRLDGLSTVRQLRRERPNQRWRIVGVSAHASGLEHQEALAAGMDAFLVKPVSMPELARALAPEISWAPPARPFDRMRAHFEQRFRADAAAQSTSIERAWASGEWKEIGAAAHYLRNSADVVGDRDLADACSALEAAARVRDHAAGLEAWRSCRNAMTRWLSDPAAN